MSVREKVDPILDRCLKSVDEWQQMINDNFEDEEEKNQEFNKLKSCVKLFCEVDRLIKRSDVALAKLETRLNAPDATGTESADQLFLQFLEEEEPSSSTDNYENSRVWNNIFRHLSDVMEVKQKKRKLDDTQFEELGDSLLCSNVFAPPIDPITKAVVRNPYKNKRCKHVYEHATIVGYIKQLKSKAKCPYIGCNNDQLRVTDLVADAELQSQITQYLETQNEESEDDED